MILFLGNGITLRQTYKKLASRALRMRSRYAYARQMKRAKKEEKRLHTYLRVIGDFERKTRSVKLDPEYNMVRLYYLNTVFTVLRSHPQLLEE